MSVPTTQPSRTTVAAVLDAPNEELALRELDVASPEPDEVLIRIHASGICHTDLLVAAGWAPVPCPVVLGHEGAGIVEAVGAAVRGLHPGDHVVTTFLSCGECGRCRAGAPSYCSRLDEMSFRCTRDDGSSPLSHAGKPVHGLFLGQSSFATRAVVKASSAVRIPPEIPFAAAAPLGCGVMTGAGAVFNSARPEPGSSIAVFGAGAVGLSAIVAAANCGCFPIVAVDRSRERLDLALDMGASHAFGADAGAVASILELTETGADYAIEAAGAAEALAQALAALAPHGTCVFVGNHPADSSIPFDMNAMSNATLKGCNLGGGPPHDLIDRIVRLHLAGRFPFERMTATYPFADIQRAVADAKAGVIVKPVLTM